MNFCCKNLRLLLIYLFFQFTSLNLCASDFYWVGGTGNWSDYGNHWATTTGGIIFHTTVPGPTDDVIFDGNSFTGLNDTVFMDSTAVYCHHMNWTGALSNPVLFSNGGSLNVYGSLTLTQGMTLSEFAFYFNSSGFGNTITTSGNAIESLIFSGGGGWEMMDSLSMNYLEINEGSFHSNDYPISGHSLVCLPQNNTSLYLGTSILHISSINANSQNIVIDADSSFIYCYSLETGIGQTFNEVTTSFLKANSSYFKLILFDQFGEINGKGNVFQNAYFNCLHASITGSNSFDTLILNSAGAELSITDTLTVWSLLMVDGSCSGLNFIRSENQGVQAAINCSMGFVNLNYIHLQDIDAFGGAVFTASNSYTNGNVSGIAVSNPAPRNLYWVNGKGHWNDSGHWSDSSGGAGGSCVPGISDNVYFDANSFVNLNDSVIIDGNYFFCKNMDWSGAMYSPCFVSKGIQLNISGSLRFISAMSTFIYDIWFVSDTSGNTITSAGQHVGELVFEGNGTWMLMDSLFANDVYIENGSLNTNNHTVHCMDFYSSLSASMDIRLGNSKIYCDWFDFDSDNGLGVLDADSAFITCHYFFADSSQVFNVIEANAIFSDFAEIYLAILTNGFIDGNNTKFKEVIFNGEGRINSINAEYEKVIFNSNGDIRNNNSFDSLLFNYPGGYLKIKNIQTIKKYFSADGSCNGYTTIQAGTEGTTGKIKKNSGNITVNDVILEGITGLGGATFLANNSINNGNVSGWTINEPAPNHLFWVGGSGSWNDPIHWSLTSGGAGGACVPGPKDSVFFDANSFSNVGDTVFLDGIYNYCKNMDWTNSLNNPVFLSTSGLLRLYGSLTLIPTMSFMVSEVRYESDSSGNLITSAGQNMGNLVFKGTGSWLINGPLHMDKISIENGSFLTGGNAISGNGIFCPGNGNKNLLLDNSVLMVTTIDFSSQNTSVNGNLAEIYCQGFYANSGQQFGSVTATDAEVYSTTINNVTIHNGSFSGSFSSIGNIVFYGFGDLGTSNSYYEKSVFNGSGVISGNNTFDTLVLAGGGSTLSLDFTQTVNKAFWTNASAGFPITIQSRLIGFETILTSDTGNTICLDYVYLRDIKTTGGALFYAGDHSVDLGNNTGWLWSSCIPDTSNVWPGDANYDLVADNIDLLYIGLAYGYTGPSRAGASTNWVAQPGIDWQQQFATGYNLKHADCDGNGTVNASDTLAVSLNYGLTHPFKQPIVPQLTGFGPDLYFEMPSTSLVPGSTVDIPIKFGTSANPVPQIYGIAFTINYDPTLIQTYEVEILFDTSWLGDSSNSIQLTKDFYNNGYIDMGFVRTDHQDISGYGTLATLRFKVAANAGGYLNLGFSNVVVIDKYEIPQPCNQINGLVYTGMDETGPEPECIVFPNPAKDRVFISLTGQQIGSVKLINTSGSSMSFPYNQTGEFAIDHLANGIYMLEITTEAKVLRKRIVINR